MTTKTDFMGRKCERGWCFCMGGQRCKAAGPSIDEHGSHTRRVKGCWWCKVGTR